MIEEEPENIPTGAHISMQQRKNYYQILQVDPAAEPEVIAAAYKRLSIKYHPDTNISNDSTRRMQQINEAFQVLKDPASRADYDLFINGSTVGADPGNGNRPQSEETSHPTEASGEPARPTGPHYVLANFIVSLSFPVTYLLLVFLLFRFFRSPSIIVILTVVIIAGIISYKVSARVQSYFRLRR
jgi:hypothetical protein